MMGRGLECFVLSESNWEFLSFRYEEIYSLHTVDKIIYEGLRLLTLKNSAKNEVHTNILAVQIF